LILQGSKEQIRQLTGAWFDGFQNQLLVVVKLLKIHPF
jgi:hypothetical protein